MPLARRARASVRWGGWLGAVALSCGPQEDLVAVVLEAPAWLAPPDAGGVAEAEVTVAVRGRAVPPGWPFEPLSWPLPEPIAEVLGPDPNQWVWLTGAVAQALLDVAVAPPAGRPEAMEDATGARQLIFLRQVEP